MSCSPTRRSPRYLPRVHFHHKPVNARLIMRRVRDRARHDELLPVWRYHPFLTDSTETTVAADIRHRRHTIVETVFADLIDGPLAHLPSVILSPLPERLTDLQVCVVDSVVDAATAGPLSAWADEFRGLPSGRVAA